jgi:hypothetical protein
LFQNLEGASSAVAVHFVTQDERELVTVIPYQRMDHSVRDACLRSATSERRGITNLAAAHFSFTVAGVVAVWALRPHLSAPAPYRDAGTRIGSHP